MARTINGNYTGRAAQLDRFDRMIEMREKSLRFHETWYETLNRLKELDPNWENWYDACPQQTAGEMLPLMKERIEQIEQMNWLDIDSKDFERTKQDLIESGHPI